MKEEEEKEKEKEKWTYRPKWRRNAFKLLMHNLCFVLGYKQSNINKGLYLFPSYFQSCCFPQYSFLQCTGRAAALSPTALWLLNILFPHIFYPHLHTYLLLINKRIKQTKSWLLIYFLKDFSKPRVPPMVPPLLPQSKKVIWTSKVKHRLNLW